ncbi:cobalamin biosynthesis protein CobW [Marinivivus vitaminiproducens]|uniref:cobalamin biosynthesis protein CobW n=1 Tax=Marinivivus vitaminiproducens TaxID=3035935 RepID=UPI00279B8A3C|nr:cobalamin biosynthesis protein CobW [Geminicoccaceae bacterium SCSIO 64248]
MSRIPATIITGFLGAGKTTLIRHMLQDTSGRRLALIVNEFGDVGVDGQLVTGCNDAACPAERIVELANGCLCCTVADDFLPAITSLLSLPEPPDHIVIETSGLALPKPLIQAFAWPDVRTRLTVDGVIAVVDAAAVRAGRFADDPEKVQAAREADPALDHESPLEEVFEEQLMSADLVVANKADLLADGDWPQIEAAIRHAMRPGAGLVRTRHGEMPASVLLGMGAAAEDDLDSRPSHHADGEDHEHDDFATFVVDMPAIGDPAGFARHVARVAREHDVLRIKGFLAVAGKPMRLLVQGVGDRVQHHYDRRWQPDETPAGRLVVIGLQGLDERAIGADLRAGLEAACTS